MPGASAAIPSLVTRIGSTVCHHLDGIAIGASVAAPVDRGMFEKFKKAQVALPVNDWADEVGAQPGYVHVVMRLLAHQGFVRLSGDIPAGETHVTLTDQGRAWLGLVDYYRQIPLVTNLAASLLEVLRTGKGSGARGWRLPVVPMQDSESSLAARVALHLHGWLVAVVMKELDSKGVFKELASKRGAPLSLQNHGVAPSVCTFVRDILHAQGWAEGTGEKLVLTAAGHVAASFAVQYSYPVSYMSTFRSMSEALFGGGTSVRSDPSVSDEPHVDRLLDVQFSGLVFDRTCKEPFFELVLPIFDREPVSAQPSCIVDTGSGDGTLLVSLYKAVRERTLRGQMLATHPLKLVGAEYTRIAKDTTERALRHLSAPHTVIFGDIGDPSGLSQKLAEHGIDPLDVLHVSKSVIHNRKFKPSRNTDRWDSWQPLSRAPFVTENGSLIPARDLEHNLVEFFEDWIPFTRKHGMVCIEAHTVDPLTVSKSIGANMMTCLDATHGFSHQYLIEYGAFLRAAQTAGYAYRSRRLLGGWLPDDPLLTIHHFVPAESMNAAMIFRTPSES